MIKAYLDLYYAYNAVRRICSADIEVIKSAEEVIQHLGKSWAKEVNNADTKDR